MHICDRILENLPSTHKRHIKYLQVFHPTLNITLAKHPDKSVKVTLNYQNYCRNTLYLIMGLIYKAAKLNILIAYFTVCR